MHRFAKITTDTQQKITAHNPTNFSNLFQFWIDRSWNVSHICYYYKLLIRQMRPHLIHKHEKYFVKLAHKLDYQHKQIIMVVHITFIVWKIINKLFHEIFILTIKTSNWLNLIYNGKFWKLLDACSCWIHHSLHPIHLHHIRWPQHFIIVIILMNFLLDVQFIYFVMWIVHCKCTGTHMVQPPHYC